MRDITGCRSGKLVALEPTGKRYNGCVVWRCRCDCGNEIEPTMHTLLGGEMGDCGCRASIDYIDRATGDLLPKTEQP